MERLELRNFQSPGDVLMMTAAVKALHVMYPGEFLTRVRTSVPQLWEGNPYVREFEGSAQAFDLGYPLVHQSNQLPFHFIHGFCRNLWEKLGYRVEPVEFKGDVYLSDRDREFTPPGLPIWLIVSGGKKDYTIKHWYASRYQQVVDYFQGRIQFVQVGEAGHVHPLLEGVLNLVGKTDVRELIRWVYASTGVLCPVTFLMHLAAAVPLRPGQRSRGAVIIAGGREAPHWEAYPGHQFLHTIGALDCCKTGGCWKSRVLPLEDGEKHDSNLCVKPVGSVARCMDMVTVDQVIHAVELYEGTT